LFNNIPCRTPVYRLFAVFLGNFLPDCEIGISVFPTLIEFLTTYYPNHNASESVERAFCISIVGSYWYTHSIRSVRNIALLQSDLEPIADTPPLCSSTAHRRLRSLFAGHCLSASISDSSRKSLCLCCCSSCFVSSLPGRCPQIKTTAETFFHPRLCVGHWPTPRVAESFSPSPVLSPVLSRSILTQLIYPPSLFHLLELLATTINELTFSLR